MEDYKDVMLSEPPSRFNQIGGGPTIQAVSLENYKGILLCDRPSNLRAAATGGGGGMARGGAADAGGVAPFLPSGKAEDRHLGLQPTQEQRAKLELYRNLRRDHPGSSKHNPALSKHRRWLKSFAAEVRNMKLNQAEQQIELQAKLQRIRDQQADARRSRRDGDSAAPATPHGDGEAADAAAAAAAVPSAPGAAAAAQPPVVQQAKPKAGAAKKAKVKPKWAMTEDEALDAEMDEYKDLIAFAQNLNYDQFIQDYEVKEALAIMRDRVKELATEKNINLDTVANAAANEVEEDAEDDVDRLSEAPSTASTTTRETFMEAAKLRREERRKAREAAAAAAAAASSPAGGVQHEQGWNASAQIGDVLRNAISSDSLALADKLLASSSSMGKVYTRYTLARLLQNCVLSGRDATQELQRGANSLVYTGEALERPKVSVVSAEATGLQPGQAPQKRILTELRKAKDKAQNLPYMYRCPSL